jgi:hypothetical protein
LRTLDGYAAFHFYCRPQSPIVEFRLGKRGRPVRSPSRALIFRRLLQFAAAERAVKSATTISFFVLVLIAFVFAGSPNVLFWSAFQFRQFAARSRQN